MKDVIFGKYNSLYRDISSVDDLYKVTLESADQRLTYWVHIKHQEKEAQKNLLSLETRDFLINGQAPDLAIDQLASRCGKTLYPLQLSLSREGELNKIYNYSALRQRWNKEKEKLSLYYNDAYSKNYLQGTDKVYNSEPLLTSRLKNTAFFYLYFGGIYNSSFGEALYKEYRGKFKGIEFAFSQQLDQQTDEEGRFTLYREGLREDRKEKLCLQYRLDNKDKSIEKAVFIYLKNNKTLQELKIERQSVSPPKPVIRQREEGLTKVNSGFWLDEKTHNLN